MSWFHDQNHDNGPQSVVNYIKTLKKLKKNKKWSLVKYKNQKSPIVVIY